MKIQFVNKNLMTGVVPIPRGPRGDVPPHVRKEFVRVEYEDEDEGIFMKVFKDEDSAKSNMAILMAEHVPPEIKIMAAQLLEIIKEVD